MDLLINMGIGVLSGFFLAGAGYFKSQEPLDLVKLGSTLAIGAVAGGITGGTGLTNDVVTGFLATAGITTFIYTIIKGLLKRA